MASKKNKKQKTSKQFIFNVTSIIIIIIIGIFYGARSMNYYAIENKPVEQDKNLVSNILNNNEIITSGNGLYQSSEEYFFYGEVTNNYINFNNQLFRIMSISNNQVKIISEENTSTFMYGNNQTYQTSNIRNYLTKTQINYSGVYLNTISNYEDIITQTKYKENSIKENKIITSEQEYEDYITTITIADYIKAGSTKSYLNNSKYFFINGTDENNNNLFIDEIGTISKDLTNSSYGVRAVFTLAEKTEIITGDGSIENPYTIDQKDNITYINNYISLGNDIWKVYEDSDTFLRLVLNDGIKENNQLVYKDYSDENSSFNLDEKNNIGYYLNTEYLNNLTYKDYLIDCNHYIGEISDATDNLYEGIYSNSLSSKVGLLNIFNYNVVPTLTNYYYLNNISKSTDIALVNNNIGILEKTNVEEEKPIVPTICIDKNKIKVNIGDIYNPHTME